MEKVVKNSGVNWNNQYDGCFSYFIFNPYPHNGNPCEDVQRSFKVKIKNFAKMDKSPSRIIYLRKFKKSILEFQKT